jgi:hypothetical protein
MKGFALTESAKTKNKQVVRAYLDCVHHKNETKNSRKLAEEERQLSCLDAGEDQHQLESRSSSELSDKPHSQEAEAGSQAQPPEISSESEDSEVSRASDAFGEAPIFRPMPRARE